MGGDVNRAGWWVVSRLGVSIAQKQKLQVKPVARFGTRVLPDFWLVDRFSQSVSPPTRPAKHIGCPPTPANSPPSDPRLSGSGLRPLCFKC